MSGEGNEKPTLEIDAMAVTKAYRSAVEVYGKGDMKESVRQFGVLLAKVGPDWKIGVPASAFLAKASLELGDAKAAAAACLYIIRFPDVALARFNQQSSHDLAAEVMGKVETLAKGEFGTGRALVERMMGFNQSRNRAEVLRKQGNEAFASKRWDEAVEKYEAAAKAFDEDAATWSNLSAAHLGAGRFEDASSCAIMAIQRDMMWSKGYFRLGMAQKAAGNLQTAWDSFTSAKAVLGAETDRALEREMADVKSKLEEAGLFPPQESA